jgi:hypothetical protein
MKMLWFRLPLALKCALPIFLLVLTVGLLLVAAQEWGQRRWLQHHLQQFGEALAGQLAQSAAQPLVQNDPVSLQAALAGIAAEQVVKRAEVYDSRQQLVAAAGESVVRGEGREFSAPIRFESSEVGRAVLTLQPTEVRGALELRDRIGLALLLALAAAALAMRVGARIDRFLARLTRKLSGDPVRLEYRGNDAFGRLLQAPLPPLLEPEPVPPPAAGALLLQLYVPEETAEAGAPALALVETVCKLYGGSATVTRAGGITARFPADDEAEAPFRALCGAELLHRLGGGRGYRIALAPLPAEQAGDPWREQIVLRELNRACIELAPAEAILIDAQLQQRPELQERCELQPAGEFFRVTALRPPYDTLLERQYQTLVGQMASAE